MSRRRDGDAGDVDGGRCVDWSQCPHSHMPLSAKYKWFNCLISQRRTASWMHVLFWKVMRVILLSDNFRGFCDGGGFNPSTGRTTRVSWHQKKSNPFCILMKQEMTGGSNIKWTTVYHANQHCNFRQITTPAPHFYHAVTANCHSSTFLQLSNALVSNVF